VAKPLFISAVPAGRLLPSDGGAGQRHKTESQTGEGKGRVHVDRPSNGFDVDDARQRLECELERSDVVLSNSEPGRPCGLAAAEQRR
jgi:hypothetical protein